MQRESESTRWFTRRAKLATSIQEFAVEALEDRLMLAVAISAAGATGEESLALQIDGQTVQTWNDIGGDFNNGVFPTLTYDVDGIAANQIRLVFLNDGVSADGEDRNLRIDKIDVDGRVIETESSNVYSTGTWDDATGCAPGFKQSEVLHCGGYFDFANVGSTIRIRAAGATGEEQMQLRIAGDIVATWNDVGGDFFNGVFATFSFTTDTQVLPEQVQVLFDEGLYDPTEPDKNLRIDHIEIDGIIYESEAPSVYSVGSWDATTGCEGGFKQSDVLHCTGYFEYRQPTGGSLIEIAAAGATGSERIELLIDGVSVRGWSNLGGDYNNGNFYDTLTYESDATVTADQIRVAFVNDGNDAQGNDRNVRIDGVTIDGVKFESESDTVFSTGTWRESDGCAPGFKASEELHCGGYLQFATTPANPGIISLETSVYNVGEEDGFIEIVIVRREGSDGLATVDYRTLDDTAVAGTDYSSVTGRAIFQDGETSQTIAIPILSDQLEEGDESFNFTIDNVGGTATLLVPRTATITIVDDESLGGLGGFELGLANFEGSALLGLNGSTVIQDGQLQLTSAATNQAGSAFYAAGYRLGRRHLVPHIV